MVVSPIFSVPRVRDVSSVTVTLVVILKVRFAMSPAAEPGMVPLDQLAEFDHRPDALALHVPVVAALPKAAVSTSDAMVALRTGCQAPFLAGARRTREAGEGTGDEDGKVTSKKRYRKPSPTIANNLPCRKKRRCVT